MNVDRAKSFAKDNAAPFYMIDHKNRQRLTSWARIELQKQQLIGNVTN